MFVNFSVPLIPQTTKMSCWAAGIAMILAWRDKQSITPRQIAENSGGIPYLKQFEKGGLNPNDTYILKRWGLVTEHPQCYTEEGFSQLLLRFGPLWVAAAVPGPHIRVVTGMQTAPPFEERVCRPTQVFINDPWEKGMREFRWPNRGSQYFESYTQLCNENETLGFRELAEPSPVYIAHLPM